jgi:RNA-binding protein|tara:strand:- start:304 stop:582 length:279 start_codon:yes stop_codon:yes gene_type:complete
LQEVGEILHLANSGRVIVRLSKTVSQGQVLCDEKSARIAKVTELIGPVAKPYASAMSLTNNIKKFVGKKMFALDTLPVKKQKQNGRKRKWRQ